jgi:hypothetical protein
LDELRNERVINPELLLRGSSPTLGASDVGSTTKRNKNKQRICLKDKK